MDLKLNISGDGVGNLTDNSSDLLVFSGFAVDLNELLVPSYINIYIAIINTIIFTAGIICNLVVIAVVVSSKHMHTNLNMYLLNLSASDLCILLVCQPVAVAEYFYRDKWFLGSAVCKMIPPLESAVHHATLLTILAITFERMYAICKPLVVFTKKRRRFRVLIPLIWITAGVLAAPFAGMAETKEVMFIDGTLGTICHVPIDRLWKRYFVAGNTVFFFILIILIIFMHTQIIRNLRRSANLRKMSDPDIFMRTRESSISSAVMSSMKHPSDILRKFRKKFSHIPNIDEEDPNMIDEESEIDDNHNNEAITPNNNQEDKPMCQMERKESINTEVDTTIRIESLSGVDTPIKAAMSPRILKDSAGKTCHGFRRHSTPETKRKDSILSAHVETPKDKHKDPITPSKVLRRGESFSTAETTSLFKRRLSQFVISSVDDHRSQIKILIIIVVYFFISYMPIRVFILWQVFGEVQASDIGLEKYLNVLWAFRLLMYLHSAANPFIYSFSTTKFIQSFKRLVIPGRSRNRSVVYSLPLSQLSMGWGRHFRTDYTPPSVSKTARYSTLNRRTSSFL